MYSKLHITLTSLNFIIHIYKNYVEFRCECMKSRRRATDGDYGLSLENVK